MENTHLPASSPGEAQPARPRAQPTQSVLSYHLGLGTTVPKFNLPKLQTNAVGDENATGRASPTGSETTENSPVTDESRRGSAVDSIQSPCTEKVDNAKGLSSSHTNVVTQSNPPLPTISSARAADMIAREQIVTQRKVLFRGSGGERTRKRGASVFDSTTGTAPTEFQSMVFSLERRASLQLKLPTATKQPASEKGEDQKHYHGLGLGDSTSSVSTLKQTKIDTGTVVTEVDCPLESFGTSPRTRRNGFSQQVSVTYNFTSESFTSTQNLHSESTSTTTRSTPTAKDICASDSSPSQELSGNGTKANERFERPTLTLKRRNARYRRCRYLLNVPDSELAHLPPLPMESSDELTLLPTLPPSVNEDTSTRISLHQMGNEDTSDEDDDPLSLYDAPEYEQQESELLNEASERLELWRNEQSAVAELEREKLQLELRRRNSVAKNVPATRSAPVRSNNPRGRNSDASWTKIPRDSFEIAHIPTINSRKASLKQRKSQPASSPPKPEKRSKLHTRISSFFSRKSPSKERQTAPKPKPGLVRRASEPIKRVAVKVFPLRRRKTTEPREMSLLIESLMVNPMTRKSAEINREKDGMAPNGEHVISKEGQSSKKSAV